MFDAVAHVRRRLESRRALPCLHPTDQSIVPLFSRFVLCFACTSVFTKTPIASHAFSCHLRHVRLNHSQRNFLLLGASRPVLVVRTSGIESCPQSRLTTNPAFGVSIAPSSHLSGRRHPHNHAPIANADIRINETPRQHLNDDIQNTRG